MTVTPLQTKVWYGKIAPYERREEPLKKPQEIKATPKPQEGTAVNNEVIFFTEDQRRVVIPAPSYVQAAA